MKNFLLLLLAGSISVLAPLSAQTYTIENMKRPGGLLTAPTMRVGSFGSKGQVSGYYAFCEKDQDAPGGMRAFELTLLDDTLGRMAGKSLLADKRATLANGVTDGKTLMLHFDSPREKIHTFRQFDNRGEEISSETWDPARKNAAFRGKGVGHALVAVPGRGFLHYTVAPGRFAIEFMPQDTVANAWKNEGPFGSDHYAMEYLDATGDLLLTTLTVFDDASRKDGQCSILGTNLATGERLFEVSLEDERHALQITNCLLDGDSVRLFGLHFPKSAPVFSENSAGLCALTMDLAGNITSRRYLSWDGDINHLLPAEADKKGEMKKVGNLFFHDFVKTADGKVFGIAENFRTEANAWGIVGSIMGTGGNWTQTVIGDFYLFGFSPGFSLHSVQVTHKEKHAEEVTFAEFQGPQRTANIIKNMGGFDYEFFRMAPDRATFSVVYKNLTPNGSWVGRLRYDGNTVENRTRDDLFEKSFYAGVSYLLPAEGDAAVFCTQNSRKKTFTLRRMEF